MGGRLVSCCFWLASLSFFSMCVACISSFPRPVGGSSLSTQKCPVFRLAGTLVARPYIQPPSHLYSLPAHPAYSLGADHPPMTSRCQGFTLSSLRNRRRKKPSGNCRFSPSIYTWPVPRSQSWATTARGGNIVGSGPRGGTAPPWNGHDARSPIAGRHLLPSQFSLLKLSVSIVMGRNCAGFDVGRQEEWRSGACSERIMCHFSLFLASGSLLVMLESCENWTSSSKYTYPSPLRIQGPQNTKPVTGEIVASVCETVLVCSAL